ncbi:MAG: hypothetical protein Q9201_004200 [Fulgogasparrea decipioides]
MDSLPHANDPGDHGPGIIAANIIVVVLATIAVGLRVVSRRMQRLSLEADDYTIFAALECSQYPQPSSMGSEGILAKYPIISLLPRERLVDPPGPVLRFVLAQARRTAGFLRIGAHMGCFDTNYQSLHFTPLHPHFWSSAILQNPCVRDWGLLDMLVHNGHTGALIPMPAGAAHLGQKCEGDLYQRTSFLHPRLSAKRLD